MTPSGQAARCSHPALEMYPSNNPDLPGKARCHKCGVWLVDATAAIEQARREEQERADVIVRDLCDRLRVSEHDRIAYRGALGYPCPGDHNGRLTDGTIPHCGLCPSRAEQARREEREAALDYIAEHGVPVTSVEMDRYYRARAQESGS